MIRIVLQGRLGNHLFQVANGLALADKNDTYLVVDTAKLGNLMNQLESLKAPIFSLDFPHVKSSFLLNALCSTLTKNPYYSFLKDPIIKEASEDWDPRITALTSPVILEGYFQNEKYFTSISDKIRTYFNLTPWLDETPEKLVNKAKVKGSVAIHVRRADYLYPWYAHYDVCNIHYYARAIALVRDMIDDPHFLVFSDDPSWCRDQFVGEEFTIVNNTGKYHNELIDMALMSRCDHQIIANSSFSWWGAWLNRNPERIVLAPDRWTLLDDVPIETKRMNGIRFIQTGDAQA
jgi:hypothetical protein